MPKITIDNVAGGAVKHLFAHELEKILNNIKDPNADAKKPRKITLEFTVSPYTDRRGADIAVSTKTTLVPVTAIKGNISIAMDPETQKPVAYSHDVRQEEMAFQKDQESADKQRMADATKNIATMPVAVNG